MKQSRAIELIIKQVSGSEVTVEPDSGGSTAVNSPLQVTGGPSDTVYGQSTLPDGTTGYLPVTVKGDINLIPGNLKKGVTVYGVSGSYEGPESKDLVVHPTAAGLMYSNGPYNPVNIVGDSNLTPENVRRGIKIFNVTGTYDGSSAQPSGPITTSEGMSGATLEGSFDGDYTITLPYSLYIYPRKGEAFGSPDQASMSKQYKAWCLYGDKWVRFGRFSYVQDSWQWTVEGGQTIKAVSGSTIYVQSGYDDPNTNGIGVFDGAIGLDNTWQTPIQDFLMITPATPTYNGNSRPTWTTAISESVDKNFIADMGYAFTIGVTETAWLLYFSPMYVVR